MLYAQYRHAPPPPLSPTLDGLLSSTETPNNFVLLAKLRLAGQETPCQDPDVRQGWGRLQEKVKWTSPPKCPMNDIPYGISSLSRVSSGLMKRALKKLSWNDNGVKQRAGSVPIKLTSKTTL